MVNSGLDITHYFKSPGSIGEDDIELLSKEIQSKPWCSAYRVLLAKGFDNENSFQKEKYLRLASTYTSDRVQLFSFIHGQPETYDIEAGEILEQSESDLPKATESNNSTFTKDWSSDSTENDLTRIEDAKSSENNTSPSLSLKIDFDEVVQYNPLEELKNITITDKKEPVKVDFDYVAYDPEKELTKLVEEKEKPEAHDFMFWLNHLEDENEAVKEGEFNPKSPDKVQSLLDQFLATKRTRPIQNRPFYNAQNKAEESETDEMDVLSETLLELYVKQGYVPKAIEGYKKLSLQNPSKSAYFAARIKELDEIKNI